jgi:hypothetical protein
MWQVEEAQEVNQASTKAKQQSKVVDAEQKAERECNLAETRNSSNRCFKAS